MTPSSLNGVAFPGLSTNHQFHLPPMAPLNLEVLVEPAKPVGSGMVAGKKLTDEVDRILRGFGKWIEIVGMGLEEIEGTIKQQTSSPHKT